MRYYTVVVGDTPRVAFSLVMIYDYGSCIAVTMHSLVGIVAVRRLVARPCQIFEDHARISLFASAFVLSSFIVW